MPGFRARARALLAIAPAVAVLTIHGQQNGSYHVEYVGLPAVDLGVLKDFSHAPDTAETQERKAVRSALRTDGTTTSRASFLPRRVIVRFRDDVPGSAREAAVRDISPNATMLTRPSSANFDVLRLDSSDDVESVAQALADRTDVVMYAQPSYRIHTMFRPNDAHYSDLQWNLPLVDLERAWDIEGCPSNAQLCGAPAITVAVLDTGLAWRNATITANVPSFRANGLVYPALGQITVPYSAAPQLVGGRDRIVSPRDFIWDSTDALDFDGHGTHVSGTIGQITNDGIGTAGVAFNVKLMPVKVLDETWDILFGAPNEGTDDVVARGIRYAADNGAKVINMSIGRNGPPAPAIEDAMSYAIGKGVFIAVAGGNGYEDGNPVEVLAEICNRLKGAVSVAAIGPDRRRAYYSTTGSYIEISAPGGDDRGNSSRSDLGVVWQQTFDFRFTDTFLLRPDQYRAPRFDVLGYIGYAGTSMATPHVAGLAALLMQQGITGPAAVEDALEKTAIDLGAPGRDDEYGFGLIDARNAIFGLGVAR